MNLAAFLSDAARQSLLNELAKHLPPSGSELHLLDVDSCLASFPEVLKLQSSRTDISLIKIMTSEINYQSKDYADAVVMFQTQSNRENLPSFLNEVMQVLRPGGRFMVVVPAESKISEAALQEFIPSGIAISQFIEWGKNSPIRFSPESIGNQLEASGFVRVAGQWLLGGLLVFGRGEKPYAEELNTLERVAMVAESENQTGLLQGTQLFDVTGRFIHLLIRQTPNKPVWALKPNDKIAWEAAVVQNEAQETVALAFTAMPKAVAFMQTAVLAGAIQDINKIAKFNKAVAAEWPFAILLNPTLEQVQAEYRLRGEFIAIDPTTAETPDE